MKNRLWFSFQLPCFLFGSLLGSPPPASSPLSVSTAVGNQVVLPCSWRTPLGARVPPQCHVQWVSPADTVFEQRGEQRFEAEEFRGRLEVPEDRLGSGDCSLIISDAQLADSGSYHGFMVLDGERARRTRVFVQSVRLSVHDHKFLQTGLLGGQLVLQLHTRFSVRVVFQSRNSSEWAVLWVRGDGTGTGTGTGPRLEKDPLLEQLTLKSLEPSDEGTYKVLDEQGLSVSTVQLSVKENEPQNVSLHQAQNQTPAGSAAQSGGSALLLLSALILTLEVLLP
ncbi:galectin 17 [Salarias fasciatus]|nr:uncharacterized protein LOC115409196 [Salarias fasciatus]